MAHKVLTYGDVFHDLDGPVEHILPTPEEIFHEKIQTCDVFIYISSAQLLIVLKAVIIQNNSNACILCDDSGYNNSFTNKNR